MDTAVAVGTRFGGIPGAVVSFIGLMAAPMAIVIMLGAVYGRFGQLPWVQQGFAGLAAAASALSSQRRLGSRRRSGTHPWRRPLHS